MNNGVGFIRRLIINVLYFVDFIMLIIVCVFDFFSDIMVYSIALWFMFTVKVAVCALCFSSAIGRVESVLDPQYESSISKILIGNRSHFARLLQLVAILAHGQNS